MITGDIISEHIEWIGGNWREEIILTGHNLIFYIAHDRTPIFKKHL